MTVGLPSIGARDAQQADLLSVGRIIVDRKGMAAEFLATLCDSGRTVTYTITSRFGIILNQQTYPKEHMQIFCTPFRTSTYDILMSKA